MASDVLGHLLINRKKVFDIALLQHFKVGFISSEILFLLEAIGVGKGYFLGIGIGTATVVIVILFLIGTAPEGTKASIMLKDEQGNPITATRIVLDGADLGSATGEVTPEVLNVGDHTIIIFWGGAKYTKTFYFSGEETVILVQLPNPVETRISVWNEDLNQPIANVTVYVDGEVQGTTSADGLITVALEPGSHTFRLLGSGVSHEEIRAVSAEANFVEFKVERTSVITVSVSDELTGNPVKSAAVYVDAVYKGETSAGGSLEISDVKDGTHEIEVQYKGSSESKSISVTQTTTSFSLSIPVPRTITLSVSDEGTGLPVDGINIYVDDALRGATTQTGELIIEDILPGRHKASLDVPGYTQMVEKYIDVGVQESVPLAIDMPNPSFVVTAKVDTWWWFDEKGRVTVTLANMGELPSEGTIAVVFVYRMDTYQKIAERIIPFGQIPPYPQSGSSPSEDTGEINEFVYGPTEEAVVIVVDKSKYVPQDEQGMTRISNSISVVGQALRDAIEWVRNNPQIIGTIAKIFIGGPLGALL